MGHSRCPNSHGDRMLDSSIESTRRVSMQYAARQRPGLIHHRGYHKLSHRRRTTTTTTTTTKREKKNSGIRSKSFRCFLLLLLLLLLPSWITETRMGRGGTRRRVKEKKKEKKKKRKKNGNESYQCNRRLRNMQTRASRGSSTSQGLKATAAFTENMF